MRFIYRLPGVKSTNTAAKAKQPTSKCALFNAVICLKVEEPICTCMPRCTIISRLATQKKQKEIGANGQAQVQEHKSYSTARYS